MADNSHIKIWQLKAGDLIRMRRYTPAMFFSSTKCTDGNYRDCFKIYINDYESEERYTDRERFPHAESCVLNLGSNYMVCKNLSPTEHITTQRTANKYTRYYSVNLLLLGPKIGVMLEVGEPSERQEVVLANLQVTKPIQSSIGEEYVEQISLVDTKNGGFIDIYA